MATLAGFEPRVFALRMQRPEPLDEKVKRSHYSDKNKILDKDTNKAQNSGLISLRLNFDMYDE